MNEFIVTFGLALHSDLELKAEGEKNFRANALYKAVFALGSAWSGNQGAVFLRSDLNIDDVTNRLASFIQESDLLIVLDISTKSMRAIGYVADEDGFNSLFPTAVRFGVSPSGGTYPL